MGFPNQRDRSHQPPGSIPPPNLTGPWSGAAIMSRPARMSVRIAVAISFSVYRFTRTFYMLDADRWKPAGARQGTTFGCRWINAAGVPTMNYYQDWDFESDHAAWRTFDRTTRDLALGRRPPPPQRTGERCGGRTATTTWQDYSTTRWESAASDPIGSWWI